MCGENKKHHVFCTVPQVYIDTRNGHWTNIEHPQAIMLDLGPWTGGVNAPRRLLLPRSFPDIAGVLQMVFGMVCSSEVLILLTVSHSGSPRRIETEMD